MHRITTSFANPQDAVEYHDHYPRSAEYLKTISYNKNRCGISVPLSIYARYHKIIDSIALVQRCVTTNFSVILLVHRHTA